MISEVPPPGIPLSPFKPTFLPSVGLTLPPDPHASSQVVATRQKLAIITDNLAVGWSGDYFTARRIITAMRDYFVPGPVTIDHVRSFQHTVCNYDDIFNSDLALVGICFDNERYSLFGLRDHRLHLPYFNDAHVAGSGYERFRQVLTQMHDHGLEFPSLGAPEAVVALAKSIFITGYLTAEEIYNPANAHQYHFGGFYETMLLTGDGVRKIDDVLFTYSQVIPHKEEKYKIDLIPIMLIKTEYRKDILFVRRTHFTFLGSHETKLDDTILVVRPIYSDVLSDVIPDINMNAKHCCHIVYVTREEGPWDFIVMPEIFPQVRNVEITSLPDGRETLSFHSDFILTIFEQLTQRGIVTAN